MNLKSQKGATGADIVIASTVIVLTIAIVSMIYVNTTLQSRNVTRTAGATRIATNVLENIEKMTYIDCISEYNKPIWENVTDGEYNGYKLATDTTVYNTKIPKGYKLYLQAEPNYGSASNNSEKFDLVRDVKLAVTYNVGDVNEKVEFNVSKSREVVNEVNEPNTSILRGNKSFYPIKYSDIANAYVKTTEDDSNWYNYTSKKWAMVVVSNEKEEDLFDSNGKLIADSSKYEKYVWIPRFFYTNDNKFSEFAYLLTNKAIREAALSSVDNNVDLNYTTYVDAKSESTNVTDMNENTGKWVVATNESNESVIANDNFGKILNESIYGPCEIH